MVEGENESSSLLKIDLLTVKLFQDVRCVDPPAI